jgi:hypothetical protein
MSRVVQFSDHIKSLSRVKRQQESPFGGVMRLISGIAMIAGPIAAATGGASGLMALAATAGGATACSRGSPLASRMINFFHTNWSFLSVI